MDSLSWGMLARFAKKRRGYPVYPHIILPAGHDEREIAVTLLRNVGHAFREITGHDGAKYARCGFTPKVLDATLRAQGFAAVASLKRKSAFDLAVQDDALTAQAKPQTHRLNACLIDKARGCGDVSYLASPVTGSGILAGRIQQLFLLARSQGKSASEEWAVFAWQLLSAQGQQLLKEGKTLTTPEDNLAELTAQAR